MAKKFNPNFIYIQSDLLKQMVAVSKKNGRVFCEDGVEYSPKEMAVFQSAGAVIDMATHRVKKIIGGEVVKIEPAGNKTKPDEGAGGKNEHNNSSTVVKVSEAHGVSTPNRDGELDIF